MEHNQEKIDGLVEKRFERLEKIGNGAYGEVWKVKERKTGKIFALKKVFMAFQNDVDAQRTYREISILNKLKHPNVVKLEEVIKAENNLDLYLLFEHVESDLFNAIKDDVLNETHKKYIIYQLATALAYLHKVGVLHRDLKPSNILINSECKIKICDFGLSRTLYQYNDEDPVMTEFIATRWYRAPEVLFGGTKYYEKSDLWSVGCLIYEMYAYKSLLPGVDSLNQILKVLEFKGFPNKKEINDLNVEKLEALLSHFKTAQLPESYYFPLEFNSNLIVLLKGLLEYSPKFRWGPSQILDCDFIAEFRNCEEKIHPNNPVVLKINDNRKYEVNFYRNNIYQSFIQKSIAISIPKTQPTSQYSKRNAHTTIRKAPSHIISHHKLVNNSNNSVTSSVNTTSASIEKPHKHTKSLCNIRDNKRNKSYEIKEKLKNKIDVEIEKSHFISKSKSKDSKENKENNKKGNRLNLLLSRGKSNHRVILKEILEKVNSRSKFNKDEKRKICKKKILFYNN